VVPVEIANPPTVYWSKNLINNNNYINNKWCHRALSVCGLAQFDRFVRSLSCLARYQDRDCSGIVPRSSVVELHGELCLGYDDSSPINIACALLIDARFHYEVVKATASLQLFLADRTAARSI